MIDLMRQTGLIVPVAVIGLVVMGLVVGVFFVLFRWGSAPAALRGMRTRRPKDLLGAGSFRFSEAFYEAEDITVYVDGQPFAGTVTYGFPGEKRHLELRLARDFHS